MLTIERGALLIAEHAALQHHQQLAAQDEALKAGCLAASSLPAHSTVEYELSISEVQLRSCHAVQVCRWRGLMVAKAVQAHGDQCDMVGTAVPVAGARQLRCAVDECTVMVAAEARTAQA